MFFFAEILVFIKSQLKNKEAAEAAQTRPFYLIEEKAYHGSMPLRTLSQAMANIFWHFGFHLIFTPSVVGTCQTLEHIGKQLNHELSSGSNAGGLDLEGLNETSDRRQRVTKRVQLARMLECIHGMRPHYAKVLLKLQGLKLI